MQVFREIGEGLSVPPNSASLWCMRGDSIQLGPEDSPYSLKDALLPYENVVAIASSVSEVDESIGYYFAMIDSDIDRSEAAFREAIRCGAGESSVAGLAGVLYQQGYPASQIMPLVDQHDVEHSPVLREIREEIVGGMEQPKQSNEDSEQYRAGNGGHLSRRSISAMSHIRLLGKNK